MHTIDSTSPLPLFFQLKQVILSQIKNGEFLPDEPLPSEKDLEDTYGISRTTVRRALGDLASEGYLLRQPGRGTFLLKPKIEHRSGGISGLIDDLAAQGSQMTRKLLVYETRPAPLKVVRRLGVDADLPVLCVVKQLLVDGEPLGVSTAYFNLDPDILLTREELSADSAYNVLREKYGVMLPRVVRTFEAVAALDSEAELLGVPPQSPVLLVELTTYDDQDRPVSLAKFLLRGDRYKYRHEIVENRFSEGGTLRVESK